MKKTINSLLLALLMLVTINSCNDKEYAMGDLTAPTDLVITTEVVGQNATNPNGDGSGDVKITVSAKNALSYKVDYDASDAVDFVIYPMARSQENIQSWVEYLQNYRGGLWQRRYVNSITKDVQVQFNYAVDPTIVTNLTGGTSKTWKIDRATAGHFGVGPWTVLLRRNGGLPHLTKKQTTPVFIQPVLNSPKWLTIPIHYRLPLLMGPLPKRVT